MLKQFKNFDPFDWLAFIFLCMVIIVTPILIGLVIYVVAKIGS